MIRGRVFLNPLLERTQHIVFRVDHCFREARRSFRDSALPPQCAIPGAINNRKTRFFRARHAGSLDLLVIVDCVHQGQLNPPTPNRGESFHRAPLNLCRSGLLALARSHLYVCVGNVTIIIKRVPVPPSIVEHPVLPKAQTHVGSLRSSDHICLPSTLGAFTSRGISCNNLLPGTRIARGRINLFSRFNMDRSRASVILLAFAQNDARIEVAPVAWR